MIMSFPNTELFAHSPPKGEPDRWHYLVDHLKSVAQLSERNSGKFGAADLGHVAGLCHDIGKANPEFQEYLQRCWEATRAGKDAPKRKTPHSLYGALQTCNCDLELLSPILAGHHAGLSDLCALKPRILKPSSEQRRTFGQISEILHQTLTDSVRKAETPKWASSALSCEFLIRMLFSALVDADWLDTESHFEPDKAIKRGSWTSPNDLLSLFEADQNRLLQAAAGTDSPVNQMRKEIYGTCLHAADGPQGVYKLTVPTGGGKTRSGMAFALKHAIQHGLDRVIFAIPYTSIIDQTAEIYRTIFGDTNVLEHHSAIEMPDDPDESQCETELRRQLASENWDMPVIVTTTVQLFESLFANKPSRCRKLHNIARSVLILDEVQTLPIHLLAPIVDALKELVDHYGVTLVLSTATQPAFSGESPYLKGFTTEPMEIVPEPSHYFQALKRVDYEIAPEPWAWERVAEEMRKYDQALCVVNSRGDALTLFSILDDEEALHLSTLMCPAHRRDVLVEIRRRLNAEEPCRVSSTQVVEAGVDLDFPVVLRAMGPLDRIVQAAGRCNREGRLESGRVIVFKPEDGRSPRGTYTTATADTRLILADRELDLHDPGVFDRYFRLLWQDCNLDVGKIQQLRERFNYEQVAEGFRMIKDDTVAVVVRYGDPGPRSILDGIRGKNCISREDWRRLQVYTVNIFRHQFNKYLDEGLIRPVCGELYVWAGAYDESTGISREFVDPADLTV